MAIKQLKKVTSTKTSAKQTSDSNVTKPTTIDRDEMKKRLGKLKSPAADKRVSDKQVSAKQVSAKQVSAKADVKESETLDMRTIQNAMEQMMRLALNMTKDLDAFAGRVTELEQTTSVLDNVVKAQSEVCKKLGDKINDLTALVEDALEGDEDEYEDEDQDEDEDEAADGCEEDDGEDDCEEGEEDDDEDEEEDDDEGDDDEDEDDMDLDPANYTPEDVMEILSDFDNADLKEIVDEVKERLELTRNYSLKNLLKDEHRRGVILQVINDFVYDEDEMRMNNVVVRPQVG